MRQVANCVAFPLFPLTSLLFQPHVVLILLQGQEVEHLKERLASATAAAKAATREKDRLVTQDSELRERLRCAERQLGAAEKAVENEKSFVNSEKLDKKRWKEEAGTLRHQLQQAQGELAAAIQTREDEENGLRQEHKAMKDLEKRLKYVDSFSSLLPFPLFF